MKKGAAVLVMLVFFAVIVSYYSGIMNIQAVDVRGYPGHDTRSSVQETSLIHPTSHDTHNTVQRGSTDGHTTASSWQTTLKTTSVATHSTEASTQSAGPTALTDVTTKVPLHSTQTITPMNTDTQTPPRSSTTVPTTEQSSVPITQMTMAAQTTSAMNTDTSPPPGSSTTIHHSNWSSTPVAQTTTMAQSTASHSTLKMATITIPSGNQTSLTTPWTTAPAKVKTTQATTTTTTHHVTATTSSATTTVGPTLVPQPSPPHTGTYLVYNGSRVCMKAEMGAQLLILDKKTYFSSQMYFNINPNVTQASGNCGLERTNLLLTFPGGFVNLTFMKVEQSYHIEMVEASLTVSPLGKVYSGLKGGLTMFETKVGHSFKCISEQSVELSTDLQLHTTDVQLQAFEFDGEHFGNADECFRDKNRRAIPVAVGLSIAGLLAVLLTACLVARKRPGRGYERV